MSSKNSTENAVLPSNAHKNGLSALAALIGKKGLMPEACINEFKDIKINKIAIVTILETDINNVLEKVYQGPLRSIYTVDGTMPPRKQETLLEKIICDFGGDKTTWDDIVTLDLDEEVRNFVDSAVKNFALAMEKEKVGEKRGEGGQG